ncbi:MAG: hypothetical protein HY246_16615 [Proteobacteria bacterium]|nr:hypothetical protein [Pseudomonadota bacterium]
MAFDALMAVLMVLTIGYAVTLNRRLAAWRRDKGELEKIVAQFDRAAERAEAGLAHLKASSADVGQLLDRVTSRGEVLRDDLVYLIDRAEPIVTRLDGVRQGPRRVDSAERRDAAADPAANEQAPGRGVPRVAAR